MLSSLVACSGEERTEINNHEAARRALTPVAQEVYYSEIINGSSSLFYDHSLCDLASSADGAGVYEVMELRGVNEELPGVPGRTEPATYASFNLLQPWSTNPPETAIARLRGGPLFDEDVTEMWDIALKVGEHVGLVFDRPTARNRGFRALNELRVFKRAAHGGWSNGQLFTHNATSATEIRTKLARIEAGSTCVAGDVPDHRTLPTVLPESITHEMVTTTEVE